MLFYVWIPGQARNDKPYDSVGWPLATI